MIGGVLIQGRCVLAVSCVRPLSPLNIPHTGKKYTLLDGVAMLCMSVGLILFTLADSTVQPDFNQTGEYECCACGF